jgi:hypothetical protein
LQSKVEESEHMATNILDWNKPWQTAMKC